ncbi:hypothetical protein ACWGH2_15165 [Streptomyces sp. NPDC054871]
MEAVRQQFVVEKREHGLQELGSAGLSIQTAGLDGDEPDHCFSEGRLLLEEGAHGLRAVRILLVALVLANPPFGKQSSTAITHIDGKVSREDTAYHRQDLRETTINKRSPASSTSQTCSPITAGPR